MKLTYAGLKDREAWEKAGITLPGYDPEVLAAKTREKPVWVHFGIGNIFRVFTGSIADRLVENGAMDTGITCVESFDYEVLNKIYDPYDNLSLNVILHADGTVDRKVIGVFGEAVRADVSCPPQWQRLQEIFSSASLQMVTFTITEKGYALKDENGKYYPFVQKDIEEALKEAGIRDKVKTMVGGAPVTGRWADKIGADQYCEDASDTVNFIMDYLANN